MFIFNEKTLIKEAIILKLKCFFIIYFMLTNMGHFLSAHENDALLDTHGKKTPLATKDFLFFSIPKAGTHLMIKCIHMLTGFSPVDWSQESFWDAYPEERMEDELKRWKESKLFLSIHPCSLYDGNRLAYFGASHDQYAKLVMVRDLRDTIVAFAYGFAQECAEEKGMFFENFDQQLTYVLTCPPDSCVEYFLRESVQGAIDLIQKEGVHLFRFEDLIGSKGGGEDQLQKQTILDLCSLLEVPISEEQLIQIAAQLFGNDKGPHISVTFRHGQIGSWRDHFKPHHIQLFNDNWGYYQQALGY